ncbi:Polynucleotidyl transferase, putative [Theobroma cacao]|uniref:Polynucleotidyl transferase, putative n=1 Tax=Theobroma cacao TaxID=3641 RepID=A0A061FI36_THECC|nr:Polynucleotidyl transferase, putative [Theobroma cacao]
MAGRIALVKSVTSSMTAHLMQTMFFPENVIQELDRLNRNFIWGHTGETRKIHSAKASNSYIWRSILKGRDVLVRGLGKNICNGHSTKFWIDNWLSCGPLIKYVNAEISVLEAELPVASFCNEAGNWDFDMFTHLLPSEIVSMIAAVLIDPSSEEEDVDFWLETSNGVFSLRGNLSSFDFFNQNLQQWMLKNIQDNTVIDGLPWSYIFVYTIWLLWCWRSLLIFDSSFTWPHNPQQQIWTKTKKAFDILNKTQQRVKRDVSISWKKPNKTFVKLSADGSARGQPGGAATGGIIRDDKGEWMLGFIHKIGITFSLNAELWALLQGLNLCWRRGFRKVQVESDSFLAIQKLLMESNTLEPNVHLLRNIKELLLWDWDYRIFYIPHEANQCVD